MKNIIKAAQDNLHFNALKTSFLPCLVVHEAPHIQLIASERIQRHNSTHCKISVSLLRWASSWRRPNQFPRDVEVEDGHDEDVVDDDVVDVDVEVFHKHDAADKVL